MFRMTRKSISVVFSLIMLGSAMLACRTLLGGNEEVEPASKNLPDEVNDFLSQADVETLFQDDFGSNSHGWDKESRANDSGDLTAEVVDGVYRITLNTKQAYYWVITSVPEFRGKDFVLSLDVTVRELNAKPGDLGLELSLREVDGVNGKHYAFIFQSDGSYYGEVWSTSSYDSAVEILGQRSTSALVMEPGITNTFIIKADDETFTLYVNGEEIATVTDGTINAAGNISINMGLESADQSVVLEIDNLNIQGIPSSPASPAEPQAEVQPAVDTPRPANTAESALAPETPSCYKWDQITLDMAGEKVCVYGVAFSQQGQSRIDFSPEKNSFFLIDATHYYPNLAEGSCVVAEEKVEVFDGKIPFMTINGDLYKCKPWMME